MFCVLFDVLLFLANIKIKNRLKKRFDVRPDGDHLYRKLLSPAVAGDVFHGVSFCAALFSTRCLG